MIQSNMIGSKEQRTTLGWVAYNTGNKGNTAGNLVAQKWDNILDRATPLCSDNQGAIFLGVNPAHDQHTKHIDVWYHYIRGFVQDKKHSSFYVNTKDIIADTLTKALPFPSYNQHHKNLGLVSDQERFCKTPCHTLTSSNLFAHIPTEHFVSTSSHSQVILAIIRLPILGGSKHIYLLQEKYA